MKVSKGQSQPQIAAEFRLLNSSHGSGPTILIPGFDYGPWSKPKVWRPFAPNPLRKCFLNAWIVLTIGRGMAPGASVGDRVCVLLEGLLPSVGLHDFLGALVMWLHDICLV